MSTVRVDTVVVEPTVDLQEAVDAAPAGGKLFLGDGTFTVPSGGLIIDKAIEIGGRGMQYGTILQPYAATSNQPVIVIKSDASLTGANEINGVYLHDFLILGPSAAPTAASSATTGCYGISIQPHASGQLVRNVSIERVQVERMKNTGLYVTGNGGSRAVFPLRISNCTFNENYGDGMFIQGTTMTLTTSVLCAGNFGRGARFESCSPTCIGDYYENNCYDSALSVGYDGQASFYNGVVNLSGLTFEDFTKDSDPGDGKYQVTTQCGLALQWVTGVVSGCKFYNATQTTAPNQYGIHVDNTEGKASLVIHPCMFDNCYIAIASTTGGPAIKQTVFPQNAHTGDSLILGVYGIALLNRTTAGLGTPDSTALGQVVYDTDDETLKFWDGTTWKAVATV